MSGHVARSLRKLIRAYSDKPKNGEEDSCVLYRRTYMLLDPFVRFSRMLNPFNRRCQQYTVRARFAKGIT